MKIFINAMNLKIGGGKSILVNYLELLSNRNDNNQYIVLVPNYQEYVKFVNSNVKIIETKNLFKKSILFPIINLLVLPKYLNQYKPDVVFSMGNIAIPTKIPQVLLLHWAYAVYPESTVWNRMSFKTKLLRKIRLYMFSKNLKYVNKLIVQTHTMKKRVKKIYNFHNIEVVPNAVSLENMHGGEYQNFKLPSGTKLLYLTYYYTHKNLEILIPLAKEIKKRKLDFKLIITIDESQDKNAKFLLKQIKKMELKDVIYNIGCINMKNVPSLYRQCNGLLMPTLLESFSGTYVEAMYHKKTIFTSDLDFAHDVCGDSAYYFDPFSATNVLDKINKAFNNEKERLNKISKGEENLKKLLNWEEVVEKYDTILKEAIK